jgi:hypothetical protein
MPIEITTASPATLSSIRLALSESYNSIPSTSSIQPFVGNNTADGIFSAVLGGQNNDTNGLPNTFIIGSNIVASTSGFTFVENLSSLGVICDSSGNSANWNSAYANAITSVQSGNNITATVTNNAATIGLNDNISVNDLTVLGTLYTTGTSTNTNVSNLNVNSTFIYLASGNPSDNYDVGLLGNYNDGIKKYAGLARNHNDKSWTLFSGLTSDPVSGINTIFPITDPTFKTDTLNANIHSSEISTNTLTATSIVATNFIDYVGGNNNKWNSAYSTVNSNSATTWNYQGTDLKNLSSGWVGGNSAYSTVNSKSANWNTAYNTSTAYQTASSSFLTSIPSSLSGNWQSTYATVCALSARWVGGNDAYTNLVTNSSAYLSAVDLSFLSVSGNWNSAYTNLTLNSAAYLSSVDLSFLSVSGNWNRAYTNLTLNSAAYLSSVDLSFLSVSGNWNSAYSTVNSYSANWNTAYNTSTAYQNASSSYLAASWKVITSNYTAVSGDRLAASTASGSFTVGLPPSPSSGAAIVVADGGSSWDTKNLTITAANTIEGASQSLICNVSNKLINLVFSGSTWRIIA